MNTLPFLSFPHLSYSSPTKTTAGMKGGGKRAAQVKAAAANKTKWREESQEAREALDSGAQSFGGSPDGTMFSAIPRLQLNLREFWRKHKQDFSDYWTRLPDAEKRGFLLASSPYMTEAYA
jgi:hypothetical protein